MVVGTWDEPVFWPDTQHLIRRSPAAAPLLDAIRSRFQQHPSPGFDGEVPSLPQPAVPRPASSPE
jgi:AsmA protein